MTPESSKQSPSRSSFNTIKNLSTSLVLQQKTNYHTRMTKMTYADCVFHVIQTKYAHEDISSRNFINNQDAEQAADKPRIHIYRRQVIV